MDTSIYIAELYNNSESFYKIGVTNRFSARKYFFKKAGYNVRLLFLSEKMTLDNAFEIEDKLHETNRKNKYNPRNKFGGFTECYSKINSEYYNNILS